MMDRIVGGICIGCIAIIIVLAIIGLFVPDNGGTSYGDPTENMTDLEKAEYNGAQIVHVTTDDTFGYCGSYSTVYQEGYEYAVIVDDVFYYLYLDEAADLMEYSPSFNKVYIAEGQATSPSKVGEIRTGLIESGVYSNGQEVDAFEFPVDKPFSFTYKIGSIGGFDNVRIVDHLYLDGGAAGANADNSAYSSSSGTVNMNDALGMYSNVSDVLVKNAFYGADMDRDSSLSSSELSTFKRYINLSVEFSDVKKASVHNENGTITRYCTTHGRVTTEEDFECPYCKKQKLDPVTVKDSTLRN